MMVMDHGLWIVDILLRGYEFNLQCQRSRRARQHTESRMKDRKIDRCIIVIHTFSNYSAKENPSETHLQQQCLIQS